MCTGDGQAPDSVAEALHAARASLDYLIPAAGELPAAACGEALTALGEIQAKFTAAHAALLRRFDALDGHGSAGYRTSAAWLAAMGRMSTKDASATVRQMRTLTRHRPLDEALGRGEVSASWAGRILHWIKELPPQLRDDTEAILGIEKILVQAAASGACLDDLAAIFARAVIQWQAEHPDPDEDDGFDDRFVSAGSTFGGAGVLRGNLTPECTAAVRAVLESLGKKAGPEDTRTEGQRFHDALQVGCELLIRAKMVPDRAGADTQVIAHIPLSQLRDMPGASEIEEAFIRSRLGEDGYLTGKDAEVAACDALTVPVVTGHADMTVIDRMIELALSAHGHQQSPAARDALRHAIARLAIDFVSGPNGIAAALRTGLLEPPFNTPSLPLDIGHSDSIPVHIRRAVILRDKHCGWPGGCDVPAAGCDVHHITHQKDGGPTSVKDCKLFCGFHHDIVIHRWGWKIILHPDGTSEAHSPDGRTVIKSHSPPTARAG
jgi:hypothetical protein